MMSVCAVRTLCHCVYCQGISFYNARMSYLCMLSVHHVTLCCQCIMSVYAVSAPCQCILSWHDDSVYCQWMMSLLLEHDVTLWCQRISFYTVWTSCHYAVRSCLCILSGRYSVWQCMVSGHVTSSWCQGIIYLHAVRTGCHSILSKSVTVCC